MSSVAQSQEIQTTTRPTEGGIITTPEQYAERMKTWAGAYHVMAPFSNLTGLAAQHGVIATAVVIDPNASKDGPQEVYDGLPFLKPNEVAIAKRGLRKLAENAGISTETVRTDPRTILFYWEVKAIATYKGLDGSTVRREATMEWDLRDGSPRLRGWTARQIEEARKHGLRACETRAVNAVIRECGCGLKQSYTREELRRPFLMVRVAFTPDMSDPDIKRLVTQSHLAGALYPAPSASPAVAAPPRDFDDVETEIVEPRHVGASVVTPATQTAQAPAADEPPTPDAVRIVEVEVGKQGDLPSGDKWTKWNVVDSNGQQHSTLDDAIAERAKTAKTNREWVELRSEVKGKYTNLVEITTASAEKY